MEDTFGKVIFYKGITKKGKSMTPTEICMYLKKKKHMLKILSHKRCFADVITEWETEYTDGQWPDHIWQWYSDSQLLQQPVQEFKLQSLERSAQKGSRLDQLLASSLISTLAFNSRSTG